MPQDSRRYRSFVTCDDPKGVVECRTIRRSKSGSSKMEHKVEHQKLKKNSHTSSAYKTEKEGLDGITERFHKPSSFRLMEVSRGAKRLNHLIDSWSNGSSYGGQSKDLAKDLLIGAIDLQESLIMLGKLQEASQYMASLKRSQRVKSDRRCVDEIGRTSSDHFSDRNYEMEFQKPRLSVDGYSRDGVEELKKVIRGNFAGKNPFSNSITEDDTFFSQKNKHLASEIPSTSSNQSSILHSNTVSSIDSSLSSSAPPKKVKHPNVIARLMGLEELPTIPVQTSPQKQTSEKVVNQRRPVFDIEKPNIRKSQSLLEKEDPKKRTLKEILETVQLKGLIKSNAVNNSHHSSGSHSKETLINNARPIVLMKPLQVPFLESNEPLAPRFQDEEAFSTEMVIQRLKMKVESPSKLIEVSEVALNPKYIHRKMEAEEKLFKKPSRKEAAKDHKGVSKPEEKGFKIKSNHCKPILTKSEEKESKSKHKSPNKTKASSPVNSQQQKKVANEKKVPNTSRKAAEKEITRLKNISISQDQDKVMTGKPREPENLSDIAKNRISMQQSTIPSDSRKPTTPTPIRKSSQRKRSSVKKEKPVSEPEAAKLDTENLRCNKDGRRIEHTREDELVDKIIDNNFEGGLVKIANEVPLKVEENDAYKLQFEESCKNSQSAVCDVVPLTSANETDPPFVEVHRHITHTGRDSKSFKTSNSTQAFLSSSPSFLSHAAELFDLIVNTPTISQMCCKYDSGVANERLTMDYAKDFLQRRSLPDSSTVHSLSLSLSCNSKMCISLDQLLDEVCAGLETLTSYSKSTGENLNADSLYSMLERDIWGNALVYGIWDVGWRNGFSMDVVERVVTDIEKLILSGLIEELFT